MKVEEAIMNRYSVRSFQDKDIPEEIIEKVKTAIWASPSADNRQPYKFIFLKDKETKEKLVSQGKTYHFVKDAPVVIVAIADPSEAYPYIGNKRKPVYLIDIGIALAQANLVLTENNIGGCWVIVFDEKKIKEILNIPEHLEVVALFPIGYSNSKRKSLSRKPKDKLFYQSSL